MHTHTKPHSMTLKNLIPHLIEIIATCTSLIWNVNKVDAATGIQNIEVGAKSDFCNNIRV